MGVNSTEPSGPNQREAVSGRFERVRKAVSFLKNPFTYKQRVEQNKIEQDRLIKVREQLVELGKNASQKPSEKTDENFEGKFNRKFLIDAQTGRFEAVDIAPKAGNLKTNVPVVMAGGAGATLDVNKGIIKKLAESGRRVLARTSPKGPLIELSGYSGGEMLRGAESLIALIEQRGLTAVDAVGHSLGGTHVVIAALLRPDLFRKIVLVDPAGMIGPDTLLGLTGRQKKEDAIIASVLKKDSQGQAVKELADEEFGKYLKTTRAIRDLHGMTSQQVNTLIESLHEKGIKIAVISGVDDNVFPMERIQKNISAKIIDGFYSVKGQHNEIQYHPELITPVVIHALNNLPVI